jgi:hypothetical protein
MKLQKSPRERHHKRSPLTTFITPPLFLAFQLTQKRFLEFNGERKSLFGILRKANNNGLSISFVKTPQQLSYGFQSFFSNEIR